MAEWGWGADGIGQPGAVVRPLARLGRRGRQATPARQGRKVRQPTGVPGTMVRDWPRRGAEVRLARAFTNQNLVERLVPRKELSPRSYMAGKA